MSISLAPGSMYGHWTHCTPVVCEFQHGATMIYVQYDDAHPMAAQLKMAQASIDDVFADIPHALQFAEQISAERNPAFWKQARRITLRHHPLAVFSVRYWVGTELPTYDVSWSPDFGPEEGTDYNEEWVEEVVRVEAPDDHEFLSIVRMGNRQFQLELTRNRVE